MYVHTYFGIIFDLARSIHQAVQIEHAYFQAPFLQARLWLGPLQAKSDILAHLIWARWAKSKAVLVGGVAGHLVRQR